MNEFNPELISRLQQVKPKDLGRQTALGANFNFESSVSTLERFQLFLLEITNKTAAHLSAQEVRHVERQIKAFLKIVSNIESFDPKIPSSSEHHSTLVKTLGDEWEQTVNLLRTTHNSSLLSTLDLAKKETDIQAALNKLTSALHAVQVLQQQLSKLPTDLETKYNDLFLQLQKDVSQKKIEYATTFAQLGDENKRFRDDQKSSLVQSVNNLLERIKGLEGEVEATIGRVEQEARKFSAKAALTTYAEIFKAEAATNRVAVARWERITVLLALIEIAAALVLFFYFLPEVLNIAQQWGDGTFGVGLLISILFTKFFILATIAVLIGYSIKSLNAQNHLNATNTFKSNSLASFQAFIEATTDDRVINQIIRQVSVAVYSQNISGYLSKDDGTAISGKDVLDFLAKSMNRNGGT